MRNRNEKKKKKRKREEKKLTAFQFDWHLRFLLGANIIIVIFRFFLVYIYMFILLVAPKLYMEGITSKCLLLYYNFSKLNLFFLFFELNKKWKNKWKYEEKCIKAREMYLVIHTITNDLIIKRFVVVLLLHYYMKAGKIFHIM